MASQTLARGCRILSSLNLLTLAFEGCRVEGPRLAARGSIAITGKVEDGEFLAIAGALEHLGMAQRANGVVVAGAPMLRHGYPGECIVFRVAFVASRSIDEVHEVVGMALGVRG